MNSSRRRREAETGKGGRVSSYEDLLAGKAADLSQPDAELLRLISNAVVECQQEIQSLKDELAGCASRNVGLRHQVEALEEANQRLREGR